MKSSNSRAIETITSSTTTKTSRFMKSMKSNHPGRLIALLTILIGLFVGVSAVMVRQVGAFRQSTSGSSESLPINQDDQAFVGEVTLTATVGTATGTFTTLKEAFDAINLGTHQGAIVISINADTTETASAVLNSGAVAPAAYTSVLIQPVGGPRTVSGTIVAAIIKLNGADNVTIDGRIAGSGRNLTVSNASVTAASAAIWLSSTGVGAGATNNIIRNLEVAGGVTNTNVVNTFGIIMSGIAITPTSGGADNDNNQFIFNRIIRARYGILTRGELLTNLNESTIINDNIIGPSAFGPDQIGKVGIFPQFENNCNINRNTVQFVGGTFATTTGGADRFGIALGGEAWGTTPTNTTNTGFTVTRNLIHDIIEERTFSSVGIAVSAINGTNPTNTLVANNMIYNVRANGTAGDQGVGIGVSGGNGDRVVFNSISMTGDLDPAGGAVNATVSQVGVRITSTTTSSNLTLKNNVISVDVTSNTATLRHYVIVAPSAAYAWGTGGLDNNVYYHNPVNAQMAFGGIGTAVPYTVVADLSAWRTTFTPNQDANSRFGDPKFVSPTADLHIQTGTPTPVESAGTTIAGVTDDFDADLRNVTTPDIGADEGTFTPLPANDIGATAIVVPVNGSTLTNGTAVTPQASFTNAGTATQNGVMVTFTITGPGGYNYTNTQTIATIAPGQTVTVTFAAAPAFTTAGAYNMTAAVITPDGNPANDTVNGSFTVANPVGGTVTVGSGGTYPSLTNPGGVFQAINILGASANITIDIVSDLTGETGAIRLNEVAGGFTVTIKPSGAARSVSGTAPVGIGMITLNGTDNVTIDGSLSGGSDRSLTLTNNQTGLSTVVWIVSASAANGANSNTVKNCIINGATISPAATTAGILAGSGVTLGNAAEAPNNNNTLTNNHIYRVQNSLYNQGNVGLDQNWSVTNNTFGSVVAADKNSFRGMLMGNAQNFVISGNIVNGVSSSATTAAAMSGIQLAFNVNTGSVVNNRISDLRNNSASGTGAFGMQFSAAPAANVTVANNFISDAITLGSATVVNNGHGININAAAPTGAYKIYHNSINMNTNQASGTTSALNLTVAVVAAGAIDLRNNILANTQTAGATRRAVHSAAAASVFGTINYNDYFSTGSVGFIGGVDRPTLANWQTGTGQDANSQAVDPLFISPTDLHLQPTSVMINTGVAGTGVTTDIDGETRDATPDIGADEIVSAGGAGTLQFSSPTYSIGEAGVQASITVTRTGGTGTVGVSYATVAGGNATGGAACGGTVDYVNTSGTLSFPDTNSQSFNIPLCDDTLDELNETVNLQLTLPTGGATLGAQSTAVLTLNDDDATPSIAIASPSPQAAPETNVGSHTVTFFVSLSAASGQTVTVHYQTNNGSATTANNDYVGIPDTIMTFNPGETSKIIDVTVNGDFTPEPDESFTVDLSTPVNATIGTGSASATIVNDDGTLSTFSINDVRTKEGNSGTHTVTFTVSLFSPSSPPGFASVQYATGGGTATAGAANPADYMSASGTATFGASVAKSTPEGGTTQTQTFTVTIIGDVNKEPNETFFVTLSNPNNGVIGDGQGVCIIFDEDRAYVADFDRDLKTDLSVFRPDGVTLIDGVWYISQSTNGVTAYEQFGEEHDKIVPGDYDSDGVTDLAVFRPSTGDWFIRRSSDFVLVQYQWGLPDDLPVQGDYDGDDKTDVAVFRPSNGTWYIIRSSDSTTQAFQWGAMGDKVVPGDYDGDGKNDFAVFRASSGTWFVQPNTDAASRTKGWGMNGDVPVSGDFDGDGSTDIAVFRPSDGNWYISTSLTGATIVVHWGQVNDIPVVGDYDADGISDIAVWRPTTGDWYILNSNDPAPPPPPVDAVIPAFAHWGQVGDKPVPAGYVPEQ